MEQVWSGGDLTAPGSKQGKMACSRRRANVGYRPALQELPGGPAPIQAVQLRNQCAYERTFCLNPGLGHSCRSLATCWTAVLSSSGHPAAAERHRKGYFL